MKISLKNNYIVFKDYVGEQEFHLSQRSQILDYFENSGYSLNLLYGRIFSKSIKNQNELVLHLMEYLEKRVSDPSLLSFISLKPIAQKDLITKFTRVQNYKKVNLSKYEWRVFWFLFDFYPQKTFSWWDKNLEYFSKDDYFIDLLDSIKIKKEEMLSLARRKDFSLQSRLSMLIVWNLSLAENLEKSTEEVSIKCLVRYLDNINLEDKRYLVDYFNVKEINLVYNSDIEYGMKLLEGWGEEDVLKSRVLSHCWGFSTFRQIYSPQLVKERHLVKIIKLAALDVSHELSIEFFKGLSYGYKFWPKKVFKKALEELVAKRILGYDEFIEFVSKKILMNFGGISRNHSEAQGAYVVQELKKIVPEAGVGTVSFRKIKKRDRLVKVYKQKYDEKILTNNDLVNYLAFEKGYDFEPSFLENYATYPDYEKIQKDIFYNIDISNMSDSKKINLLGMIKNKEIKVEILKHVKIPKLIQNLLKNRNILEEDFNYPCLDYDYLGESSLNIFLKEDNLSSALKKFFNKNHKRLFNILDKYLIDEDNLCINLDLLYIIFIIDSAYEDYSVDELCESLMSRVKNKKKNCLYFVCELPADSQLVLKSIAENYTIRQFLKMIRTYNYKVSDEYYKKDYQHETFFIDIIKVYEEILEVDQSVIVDFNKNNSIIKLHDNLVRIMNRLKHKNFKLNLSNNYKLNKINKGKFKFHIPRTNRELLFWGQKFNNCVGSYGKRCLGSKTLVLALIEEGEYKYILEYRDGRVIQCMGPYNKPAASSFTKKVESFLQSAIGS